MTITEVQQEVWQNDTEGQIAVIKLDRRGELVHEMVRPRGKFNIRTEERLLNQDRAAERSLDVFMNGTLTPVRLIEDAEGAAEIASNPNLLGESEIKGLFKDHYKTFEKRIGEIDNTLTLRRLLDVAEEVDATVRQVKIISARIEEVSPRNFVEVSSHRPAGNSSTGMKPVSPK